MKRHKIIRALMTTVVALFFLSATAAGKVEVIGDGSQGTVDWKAEGAVITLTVTPAEGHFIRKSDITLTKTYMPTAAPRRAEVPIGDGLTLVGADPDDLSLPRTYTVTMPGEEYDLLVKLQFSNCQAITESTVRLSETVFVYNEDAQRPKVFINGLTEDKDFTVTYDNPASTATGEYGITIKGRSTWTGTVRRTYKIFAGGKAEVNKSIAGGTIATAVDGLTVTLTVTPTDGYYIRKQDIAVAKTYMPVAAPRRSIPVADRLELTGDDPDDLSLPRTYTAQLPGWEYSVYVDATFTERQTITEGMVALSATSFVYNTNDQKPVISVTGLTEGKDYLVAYNGTSWTDVDTYKVTITGRSTWKGTINRTWSITKAPSEVTTAPKTQSLIYTKTAQQLVSVGDAIGGTLVYGLDSTALQTVIPKGVNAGNYTVYYKVVGDANHFDSKVGSVPVTIDKKAVVVSGITAQNKVFDRTTAVTFLYDGTIYSGIVEGDVLSITAEGAFADTNAAVDKVVNITSLTLGGASIANYQLAKEGQQTTTKATITPKSIEGATVADIPAQLYTGQPVLPEVHVTLDEVVLVAGTDYTTEGTDNVSVGTATLTVKGKGNYQNSIQKTFTIGKKAIVISGIAAQDKVYDGTTTATLIYDEVEFAGMAVGDTLTVTAFGEFANADAGTEKTVSISHLTLHGNSVANYKLATDGHQATTKAAITPKSIEGAVVSDIPEQPYTGQACTPPVIVTLDKDTLVLDKDYTVAYTDNIEAGTATVTATGKGNYQNSVQQHFSIGKKAVAVSGITAEDKVYDGTTTATLNYDAVVFTGLAEGDTLTVTAIGTFADANAGTDKVVSISQLTLGGTSITNYVLSADGQQTEAKATITPRSIQDGAISNADSLDYTGQPLTPEVSVTLNGDTLKLGNDYTLDYADNVNAGNATITATGIGNYQDNIQKTFVINKVPSSVVTAPKALALDYTGQEQTLIVGGEASGGTMVYSTNGTTFDTSLPTATDEGLHKVYYKVQGDINHLDTQVDTLTCSITPKLVDNSGNEVDADFIEGENGNTEVVVNTLPEGFYEDTSKLSTTVSDENNNSYQVTQVNAEAFNEMPNDILVVLPEGVSTTEGVTNVVNGDGTCETMDLTDVDNYNVPIDVAVDNVIYTREVEGNEPISVCLPYDADVPEGYNAYSMQLNTANEIVMNLVTSGKMEAYQPYLLQSVSTTPSSSPKKRTEGVEKVTLSAQNVTIKPSAVGSVTAGNFELRGTVSRMTHAEGVQLQAYILQSDQSWKMTASSNAEDADKTYLSAFQAYLLYHGEGELTEISIPLEGSGEATAIIVIKNDEQQKRYYNLNGQRVSQPVKGINIVDGKKVIVK